jgi:hypothetical protein
MEIVSGTKMAAAIDDLATNDLENAEEAMAEQLSRGDFRDLWGRS